MIKLTRRDIGVALGAAATLGGSTGAVPVKAAAGAPFPTGFKWGCATAAYQIEGAANEDGRGQSIWDVFSHAPGNIADGATGDVACDSYRRYREDTQLLKGLGAKAYRFSIAWPRIFPEGRGSPNQKGVDHYDRLVNDLLANGIEPWVTLFHWDLPMALPGGWQSRDTAYAFADYAGFMAEKLSDRVKHFITLNEMSSFVDLGYKHGLHAPGLRLPVAEVNQVRHHALLAHGLGAQAIRAHARPDVQVGLAENPIVTIPAIGSAEHIAAARNAMREMNAGYLTAVMEGRYTDHYLTEAGAGAPKIAAGDMGVIGSPLDFVGINIYTGAYVTAAPDSPAGFTVISPPASYPRMILAWLMIAPESLYWGPRFVTELWKPKAIFISENGAASDDKPLNGRVEDTDRLMFLGNYLRHLQRATAEGYPVKGYFLWSLLDNFEWAEGYTKRFGIHYTNYATQARSPKLSAAWYGELIRRNALV
ncbi:GH1 family beta-glucosidase [Rhizorhabdus argentea]|uniref:GH1 family beta-glucosidase n=1 Tax=Rhizorhabdus argentea TaxID=1387174 RepID=UPI0030EF868F